MADGYLDYQQMASVSLQLRNGATEVALGVVSIFGGALALPELAALSGIAQVLGSFSAIGSLAGGLARVGIGVGQISGGNVSSEDAKFVVGMANPLAAPVAALAAPTGEKNVRAAVEQNELMFRLMEFGNLISSPPHSPEIFGPVINIFVQPSGDVFINSLEEDLRGLDQRPLDISVSPVFNNFQNPVTAPSPATEDPAGAIDNSAESSSGSTDASENQGGADLDPGVVP